jgi:hypothetical protein
MDYKKFTHILNDGETQFVDFKVDSSVFQVRNRISEKAELVNGNRVSYIVYGISDDGKKFRPVKNDKLTEDNVQTLCTNSISPPPKIRLHKIYFTKGRKDLIHKLFVAIQIGPQARKAFRFSKDFINYSERVCFRNNEVWIRRNATSGLATPEEIESLVRGKSYMDLRNTDENPTEFLKLPISKQTPVVKNELTSIISDMGGVLFDDNVLKVRIDKEYFVIKVIIVRDSSEWIYLYNHMRDNWMYEHGYLIISLKNIPKKALPPTFAIQYKESWGWFSTLDHSTYPYPNYGHQIPENSTEIPFFLFFLGNIKNTNLLSKNINALFDYIENSTDTYKQLHDIKKNLNKNLSAWLKDGWHSFAKNTSYLGNRPPNSRLRNDEFFSTKHRRIIKRNFDKNLVSYAKRVLLLSK